MALLLHLIINQFLYVLKCFCFVFVWCPCMAINVSVCMYVCMYGHHIYQSMDQPGKVANPARGQLNRENEHSPVPVRA